MEFILSQQAGFGSRQAVFDERLAKLTAVQDSQQKSIFDLIQAIRTGAERQDKQSTETDQKINQLTENMNALIKLVDGLVRRDNGRPSA